MPSRFELGIHPLTACLVALQLAVLAATVPLYPILGFTVVWRPIVPALVVIACLLISWTYFVKTKTTSFERRLAETLLIFALLMALAAMLTPAASAMRLVDAWSKPSLTRTRAVASRIASRVASARA